MESKKIKIHLLLSLILLPLLAMSNNIMSIPAVQVGANQVATVNIEINNSDAFVGFQADIPLPGQFTFVAGSAQLDNLRSNGHVLSATLLPGNILRLIAYSFSNSFFTGSSGTVASFNLQAATVPGWYALYLNNAIIGDTTSVTILTSAINGSITLQAPDINLTSSSLNFGEIPLLQTQSKSLTIQNLGNQALSVTDILFDSPWFSVSGDTSFSIASGSSHTVIIIFDSQVKGTYSNTISLLCNDPDEATKTATLNAYAFAVNELHTGPAFAFSGDQVDLSFSINNMEAFTGFQFDLTLPSAMSYVSGSANLSTRANGHLASGNMVASNKLRVVAYSVNNSNFSGNQGDVITLSFLVNGTAGNYGLSLSNVIIGDTLGDNVVSEYYNGQLQIAAADIHGSNQLSFGEVSVTDTATANWTVYNYGQDTLSISSILFTNPDFWSGQTLPLSILPGQNSIIPVQFHAATEGNKTSVMKIFSNDPNENPFNVNLTANSYYPNYMRLDTMEAFRSSVVEIPVYVNNYENFVGFQFDLSYPGDLTLVSGSSTLGNRAQDHVLLTSSLGAGSLRAFSFSMTQAQFTGNSGVVAYLSFNTNQIENGTYNLALLNGILGDNNSENILYGTSNGLLVIADSLLSNSSITQPSFKYAGDGQIILNISGGTSPYTIEWSNGESNSALQDLGEGFYSVTITDSYEKSIVEDFNLVDPAFERHQIPLKPGWGLISTYLVPLNNTIIPIFSEVQSNLIIMKNENGGVYWPFFGLDMIGSMTLGKGYQINMLMADTLNLIGYGVSPDTVMLNIPSGWSLLGYLRRNEASVVTLLSPIVSHIAIMKDESGAVYWPFFNLNMIGNMKPGKGYQIRLTSAQFYSFPAD